MPLLYVFLDGPEVFVYLMVGLVILLQPCLSAPTVLQHCWVFSSPPATANPLLLWLFYSVPQIISFHRRYTNTVVCHDIVATATGMCLHMSPSKTEMCFLVPVLAACVIRSPSPASPKHTHPACLGLCPLQDSNQSCLYLGDRCGEEMGLCKR